jgi:protein O-mannosyl-transferase
VRRLLPPALIALVAAAVYAQTLSFDFVYDDVWAIANNPQVHSLANWREILTSPYWKNELYRPLTSLTFAADWTLWGGSPAGYHLTNVLCHVLASLLVYALAAALLGWTAALAAALIFAVHPVHVEAVASVVGRAEILATVLVLAAALLYRRHGDLTSRGDPAAAEGLGTLVTAGLALASKESAFATPGLLLVMDWLCARTAGEPLAARFRRQRALWVAVLVLSLSWLWLRTHLLGGLAGDRPAAGLADTALWERLVIMLPVVTEYVRLLLVPFRLSADYSPDFLPVSRSFTARTLLGMVLLTGCLVLALASRRRAPGVTAGIAWTGVSLFVVSNVLVPTGILLSERTQYLASVGVCLALGWAASEALRHRPVAGTAVLTVLVGLAAARSWPRAGVWRDNDTFFSQLVLDAPGSYRSDWVAGMRAYAAGDPVTGERLMKRGLRIYPGNPLMWMDFAKVMERRGRWREAGDYHWAAFLADSALASEAARAIASSVQAGELDTATARLAIAERRLPASSELSLSASHLAMARGDAARAASLRVAIARAHPADYRYWLLAGQAALQAGDCTTLAESVARLDRLRPDLPPLTRLRGGMASSPCAAARAAVP